MTTVTIGVCPAGSGWANTAPPFAPASVSVARERDYSRPLMARQISLRVGADRYKSLMSGFAVGVPSSESFKLGRPSRTSGDRLVITITEKGAQVKHKKKDAESVHKQGSV